MQANVACIVLNILYGQPTSMDKNNIQTDMENLPGLSSWLGNILYGPVKSILIGHIEN